MNERTLQNENTAAAAAAATTATAKWECCFVDTKKKNKNNLENWYFNGLGEIKENMLDLLTYLSLMHFKTVIIQFQNVAFLLESSCILIKV